MRESGINWEVMSVLNYKWYKSQSKRYANGVTKTQLEEIQSGSIKERTIGERSEGGKAWRQSPIEYDKMFQYPYLLV